MIHNSRRKRFRSVGKAPTRDAIQATDELEIAESYFCKFVATSVHLRLATEHPNLGDTKVQADLRQAPGHGDNQFLISVIRHPENVASFFRSVAVDNSREQFMAMYLDASHCVISYSLIAIGSAVQVSVTAPEIFQRALLVGAVALAVAHNHPSNRLEPSDQDIAVTTGLKKA